MPSAHILRSVQAASRRWHLCAPLFLLLLGSPAASPAAVEIAFHSHAMGSSFPHALIVLRGTLDSTGERVDVNYGFTVRHLIGPSVLFGPVEGEVMSESRDYVAHTRRHFAITLTDDQYRQIVAVIERWRGLPQPSYRLDRRTCVSFVAAIAAALGLQANPDAAMLRRPGAFLDRVAQTNRAFIERWTPEAGRRSAIRPR